METERTMKRISEAKVWFFEKTNKFDQPCANPAQDRQKTQHKFSDPAEVRMIAGNVLKAQCLRICILVKHHDHQQCGAEGLFYFHVHITVTIEGSHGMDANEAGAWNPGLLQRLWWSAAYCFAFMPGLLYFTAPAVWDHYPISLALPDCWDLLLLLDFTFTYSLSWDLFRYSGPYTWSSASTSLHNPFNYGLLQLRLCLHPWPSPVPSLSYSPHTFMPLKPVPAE